MRPRRSVRAGAPVNAGVGVNYPCILDSRMNSRTEESARLVRGAAYAIAGTALSLSSARLLYLNFGRIVNGRDLTDTVVVANSVLLVCSLLFIWRSWCNFRGRWKFPGIDWTGPTAKTAAICVPAAKAVTDLSTARHSQLGASGINLSLLLVVLLLSAPLVVWVRSKLRPEREKNRSTNERTADDAQPCGQSRSPSISSNVVKCVSPADQRVRKKPDHDTAS